ncbi:MAG TPA: hypothetical protein VM305_01795 [Candidatus Limnocylindrales bacterium]|nr:hypothetical protein [Candidatus Limnocylindrales bacterium]
MSGQPIQPVTGRTGGGVSARVAAVIAVGVLAAFVWAGLSGRDQGHELAAEPTPPLVVVARPSPSLTEPAAAPTPAPSTSPPSPPATRPVPTDDGTPLPLMHRTGPLGEDAFAIALWLEERFYMSVLREQTPGTLTAAMRLPLYAEMPTTTLQLIQLWTREDRPPLAEIADYSIDLSRLTANASSGVLVGETAAPRPRRARAPRLVREGYELVITSDVRDDHAFLLVDLRVGDASAPETGTERLERMTRGWADYGRRGQTFVLDRSWPDAEGGDITLWSCNDQGLTWAARQDCGARPGSITPAPPSTRGTR